MPRNTPSRFAGEDLATERHRADGSAEGVLYREAACGALRLCALCVEEAGETRLEKPRGKYLSLSFEGKTPEDVTETLPHRLAEALAFFLGRVPRRLLVIGLGNRRLTADAFGPLTADGVEASGVIPEGALRAFGLTGTHRVFVTSPDVAAKTGIESARVAAAVAREVRADALLTLDSLATVKRERLLSVVEITNTGTVPGGGVGARPYPLSASTLGIPVVSLGVPTVVQSGKDFFTVSRRMEESLDHLTRLTAEAINRYARAPHLSYGDAVAQLFSKEDI